MQGFAPAAKSVSQRLRKNRCWRVIPAMGSERDTGPGAACDGRSGQVFQPPNQFEDVSDTSSPAIRTEGDHTKHVPSIATAPTQKERETSDACRDG